MFPIAIGFGPAEIAITAILVLLLFGVKRLPELGKSLAEGITEFKKASKKAREDDTKPEETKAPESQ